MRGTMCGIAVIAGDRVVHLIQNAKNEITLPVLTLFTWSPQSNLLAAWEDVLQGRVLIVKIPDARDSHLTANLAPTPITSSFSVGGASTGPPRWSPNGRFIAFRVALSGDDMGLHTSLYVVEVETGKCTRLATDVASDLSWAADSETLYFVSGASIGRLYRVSVQNQMVTPMSIDNAFGSAFLACEVSPDGKFLLLTGYRTASGRATRDLFLCGVDGRGGRWITQNMFILRARWQPVTRPM